MSNSNGQTCLFKVEEIDVQESRNFSSLDQFNASLSYNSNENRGQTCLMKVEEMKIQDFSTKNPLSLAHSNAFLSYSYTLPPLSLKAECNVESSATFQKKATNDNSYTSNDLVEVRQGCSIDPFFFDTKSPMYPIEEKKWQCDETSTISKMCFERLPLSSGSVASIDKMNHSPNSLPINASKVARSTELEIEVSINHKRATEGSYQLQNQSNLVTRQDHVTEDTDMPPLCSNTISTPCFSIQFSPLLSFSEERITNSLISGDFDESEQDKVATQKVGLFFNTSSTPSTLSKTDEHAFKANSELTYADHLLFNASQGRPNVATPIPKSLPTPKISDKKRKASNECRTSRQPQKRFSIDVETNEISGGDLFVSKRDGRVRLTTNLPRKVEALDPLTGLRAHLYASCSEASRVMSVNRTRMSRSKSIFFFFFLMQRIVMILRNFPPLQKPVEVAVDKLVI